MTRSAELGYTFPSLPFESEGKIGFRGVTFSWDSFHPKNVPKSTGVKTRKPFRLVFDEEVVFKQGALNLILGPTASGKVSYINCSLCVLLSPGR